MAGGSPQQAEASTPPALPESCGQHLKQLRPNSPLLLFWRRAPCAEGALPPGPYGREGPEYVSSRWDNPMHRSRSRGSDTDRDWEQYERRGRLHEVATASVFIKVCGAAAGCR